MILLASAASAQEESDATAYQAELFGSAATGAHTPFWMVSNRYGMVPLEAGNAYLAATVTHRQSLKKHFRWEAGMEMVAAVPRYRNLYLQQLYMEVGYRSLTLSVGSRKQTSAFGLDSRLSSGDVIYSTNARPLPEIRLAMPRYTQVPLTRGWLQVKGDFTVGRSFDNAYLADWTGGEGQSYIKNILWHYKSLHLRVKDSHGGFPLYGEIGVQHVAQWGGTSTHPGIGKQPASFKDFLRIVCGSKGGSDATVSDQINVLGSHHIAYDFRLGYAGQGWQVAGYHQHLCYDKSGMEFYNGADGLWGVEVEWDRLPWLQKVVVEYFTTRNGSGPFHYIRFDHEVHPGRGGGGDDYYNNGEYVSGNSYFNQSIGSPLVPSPIYNEGGKLGFEDNRVRAWHVGATGSLAPALTYRLLLSVLNGWGTAFRPFLTMKRGVSGLASIAYAPDRLPGWIFTGSVAMDTGSILGEAGTGFSLSVRKEGILKRWK